jgi:phosphatidylserine/phosphatidylglycerophosphate/cardiolipin synthase-like enzyme
MPVLHRIASSLVAVVVASAGAFDPAAAAPSERGRAIITALGADPADADRGVDADGSWNFSNTNRLPDGWLVQSPPLQHWGRSEAQLTLPSTCVSTGPGDIACDHQFGLHLCTEQNAQQVCGPQGSCQPLAASVSTPGAPARRMCVGHSDQVLLDGIYDLVKDADIVVDVTSLAQAADGRFLAALRNAITYLGHRALADGQPRTVRLLFGRWKFWPIRDTHIGDVDTGALLAEVTAGVPDGAPLTVHVGTLRSGDYTWNHAKMVAVDGRRALVGGHNMWTVDYLNQQPVHDMSMRVEGPAAVDAHAFADELWKFTIKHPGSISPVSDYKNEVSSLVEGERLGNWLSRGKGSKKLVKAEQKGLVSSRGLIGDVVAPQGGTATVISVGRLGGAAHESGIDAPNPADLAISTLLASAVSTIRISQQDIAGDTRIPTLQAPRWIDAHLDAIAGALLRGVQVHIVVSSGTSDEVPRPNGRGTQTVRRNPQVGGQDGTYYQGTTLSEVADEVARRVAARSQEPEARSRALCNLWVAPLRYSKDPGDLQTQLTVPPANHTKLVLVDSATFYPGSQNLYPTGYPSGGLAEFGYIVDDADAAQTLITDYWNHVWRYSSRIPAAVRAGGQCTVDDRASRRGTAEPLQDE